MIVRYVHLSHAVRLWGMRVVHFSTHASASPQSSANTGPVLALLLSSVGAALRFRDVKKPYDICTIGILVEPTGPD